MTFKTDKDGEIAVTWPAAGMYWLEVSVQDEKAHGSGRQEAPRFLRRHLRSADAVVCCARSRRARRASRSPAAPRSRTPQETLLSGQTMGSAWTVKIAGALPASAEGLRAGVQARFDAVNLALSTYRADSALSRFNDVDSGEWVAIDAELGEVLRMR